MTRFWATCRIKSRPGADSITVDGKTIKVFKEKDPAALPWESVGAQVVIESTGRFTDANDAKKHHARAGEEGHHLGSGEE